MIIIILRKLNMIDYYRLARQAVVHQVAVLVLLLVLVEVLLHQVLLVHHLLVLPALHLLMLDG